MRYRASFRIVKRSFVDLPCTKQCEWGPVKRPREGFCVVEPSIPLAAKPRAGRFQRAVGLKSVSQTVERARQIRFSPNLRQSQKYLALDASPENR